MVQVLIADDDKDITDVLTLFLESESMDMVTCHDGISALETLRNPSFSPDVVILDIMMPGLNGYELVKRIREESTVPIIMLSAKVQPSEKILALDLGADDYISKPFEPLEVVSRVKASIRRAQLFSGNDQKETEILQFQDIILDIDRCELSIEGQQIDVTATEWKLMKLFMTQPGRVFTREQIFEAGWGDQYVDDNVIQVAISKLRQKIGENRIKTVRGLGYKLQAQNK